VSAYQAYDRPLGFAGQRTQKLLKDMGDELHGMGAYNFDNENDYMVR